MGSKPSALAMASICDSMAKVAWGAPGARYAPTLTLLVTTSKPYVEVREAVVAADEHANRSHGPTREAAGIDDDFGVERGQCAVLLHAGTQLDDGLRRGHGALQVLGARPGQLDRPAQQHREAGGKKLRVEHLATEAAARLHAHDIDPVLGQTVDAGQLGAHRELALRAGPDVQVADRIVVGDRHVRLDVA